MGNTFADALKEGVFEKMKAVAEQNLTKEEREEIRRYEKDRFKSVQEMVEYMRHGGCVSPLVSSSICKEGYRMNPDGSIRKDEVIYDNFGNPYCVNHETCSVDEFLKLPIFGVKNHGFIMCWIKK